MLRGEVQLNLSDVHGLHGCGMPESEPNTIDMLSPICRPVMGCDGSVGLGKSLSSVPVLQLVATGDQQKKAQQRDKQRDPKPNRLY